METFTLLEKTITDYENYSVDYRGNVRNLTTNKYLKNTLDKDGYVIVGISIKGRKKILKIHKILAQLFLGIYGIVDHLDRNKLNNKLSNLRLANMSQNSSNRICRGYSYEVLTNKKNEEYNYYCGHIKKDKKLYTFYNLDLQKILKWRICKEIHLFQEFICRTKFGKVQFLKD